MLISRQFYFRVFDEEGGNERGIHVPGGIVHGVAGAGGLRRHSFQRQFLVVHQFVYVQLRVVREFFDVEQFLVSQLLIEQFILLELFVCRQFLRFGLPAR